MRIFATVLACASVFGMFSDLTTSAQDVLPAGNTCGPPIYCARSDVRVEPYPKTALAMGPAGTVVRDPSFASRILRVTDAKTYPQRAGVSYSTPSSSEQNSWNVDSTRFYVRGIDGSLLLFDFDPSNMTLGPQRELRVAWIGEPQFSYSQSNILFGITSADPRFQQYDISTNHASELHEASKCVKLSTTDLGHDISVSADDQRMTMVIGPEQDSNYLVYVYDRAKGCRWYNARTGEVGGQWGPKGAISNPNRYLIHDARMNKSGQYIEISRSGADVPGIAPAQNSALSWLWKVDSIDVTPCGPKGCKGHHALGYSHLLNPSEQEHPMDLWSRPLDHLDRTTPLIKPLPAAQGWYDLHISWNNVNVGDSNPACLSTYRRDNSNRPGTAPTVLGPWENEIVCVKTEQTDSKVWRFAHTYSTAQNGFWSSPRGNVSQDGRFYMFTSDWEDQLGRVGSTSQFRTDVFIVELK